MAGHFWIHHLERALQDITIRGNASVQLELYLSNCLRTQKNTDLLACDCDSGDGRERAGAFVHALTGR